MSHRSPPGVAPLRYRLEPHDLYGHRCRVTLNVAEPAPEGQRLIMPAWIPGSYLMREFARQVEQLTATDAKGQPVPLTKIDRNTWQAAPCTGPLSVQAIIYCWDLSVRSAHLDDTHGFFNGTCLFLQPTGLEHLPCLLEVVPPPPEQTRDNREWRVYTSLPEARGEPGAASRHGFGWYRAPDYDALLDHPIEMGTPQVVSFEACGALHEMVFTGVAPGLDLNRIAADTRRICEAEMALFETVSHRAPFLDSSDRYVFLTQVTGDGYGGLEHRASTALMTSRRDLPVVGNDHQSDGYRGFLGLISHEYFHTWHVKRIKPAVFAPYDLAREGHTRLLWVFEGFTSYYDDLLLLRSGVIDQAAYLKLLARTISLVQRNPGRHKQSVAESSFDAWTRFYRQDENSPNALVSYYTKGALIALGLDITIRQTTAERHSLDDVMRLLWQRFGREFYRGEGRGVGECDMIDLIAEATGVDTRDFLERYVHGCDELPLTTWLDAAGHELTWEPASEGPVALDARTRVHDHQVELATVFEGGNAHRAGLSAKDVLVAIDGLRIQSAANLDATLSRHRPGDTLCVHVFRGDELRWFHVPLEAPARTACRIMPRKAAEPPLAGDPPRRT